MHGHELDRRDTELQQMADRAVGRERLVRPANPLRQPRLQLREAAHVHLVDDRLVPRRARPAVVAPGERRIHDRGKRGERGAVARIEHQVRLRLPDGVPEHRIVPPDGPGDRFCVRVEHHLVRVEPVTVRGIPGAVDAITVELARPDIRHVAVPVHVRLLGQRDPLALGRCLRTIEEAQVHTGRVLGKDGEVDAEAVPRRAERIRLARPDADGAIRGPGGNALGAVSCHRCSAARRTKHARGRSAVGRWAVGGGRWAVGGRRWRWGGGGR